MNKEYVYNIGDIIKTNNDGLLKILELIRIYDGQHTRKGYKYKCLKCNNESQMIEPSLLKGCGCNVCGKSPKKVLKGINDIKTTSPWMITYFINSEDANKFTSNASTRLDFKCPNCGYVKNIKINNLYHRGFCCPKCGDGKSYPEKIMLNVLQQLNVEFETQKSDFEWIKSFNKKYDFYIPSIDMIIETHGEQHYRNINKWKNLQEQQENDLLKLNLAKNNNINEYIIIDCRKSELNFIKKNILTSKLTKYFDLSKIDWVKCHEYACNSLVKIACDIFNSGIINTTKIGKIMNLERSTICKYLKMGNVLDWCQYTKETISQINSIKAKERAKKVRCIDNNMIFNSCSDVENRSLDIFGVLLKKQSVSRVCQGDRKHYKGFHFEFIN